MCRCKISCFAAITWVVLATASLRAAEPFGLPDCVADLGSEVVLNAPMIEAMIVRAEPGGTRPNLSYEKFFIVAKHYLGRSRGLLLLTRQASVQRPLLLTDACTPYPGAPAHIRAYFANLTPEQHDALVFYRDLIWPHTTRPMTTSTGVRYQAMARVPAGRFKGSDGHDIQLDAFEIDVHEVTNADYRQFIDAGGYTNRQFWSAEGWEWLQAKSRRQPTYWDNEQLNTPTQPVVGVTWYEAMAYCQWAGKALPTERQWEKACRGNDGRAFPWGNQPLLQPHQDPGGDRAQYPLPVGSAPQTDSPYGVQDLAGNVLEWTQTTRDDQQMVLCGGSGSHYAQNVGCGVRHALLPGIAANFIGFRCQSTSSYKDMRFPALPSDSGKRADVEKPVQTDQAPRPLLDENTE